MAWYTREIRAHILRIVRFVIVASGDRKELKECWWHWSSGNRTMASLPREEVHSLKRFEDADDEYNCFYYAPIISYTAKVIKHLGLKDDYEEVTSLLAANRNSVLSGLWLIGDNRVSTGSSATFCAHKWHHYEALVEVTQLAWGNLSPDTPTPKLREAREKAERWRSSLNNSLASLVSSGDSYTLQDEVCDRLVMFLTEREIGTGHGGGKSRLATRKLASRHLSSRTPTMVINPGRLTNQKMGRFVPPTAAPWELHALCHHAALLEFPTMQGEAPNRAVQNCLQFLCSDESIIPTWERSTVDSLAGWFSLEPTCVIATTMLERLVAIQGDHQDGSWRRRASRDRGGHAATGSHRTASEASDGGSLAETEADDEIEPLRPAVGLRSISDTIVRYSRRHLPGILPLVGSISARYIYHRDDGTHEFELGPPTMPVGSASADVKTLADALRFVGGLPSPIDWALYRFPHAHHPDAFLHSLDDSPHLFTDTELGRIELRPRLAEFLGRKPGSTAPKYHLEKLGNTMTPDLCSKVSIIDLMSPGYFMGEDGEPPKLTHPVITGRISPANFLTEPCGMKPAVSIPLYAAFLDGAFCAADDDAAARWGKELRELRLDHDPMKTRMSSKKEVGEERARLQANLLAKLGDSLVDQQVQCRYL